MVPSWIMGSEGVWFAVLNAVVVAIALLSRARPSRLGSPRRGGVTRRASSAVLHRLCSFSIFSYPSACLSFLHPDAAAAATSQELVTPSPRPSRALAPPATPSPAAAERAPPAGSEEEEDDGEEEGDPNAMSMDEVYALVLAGRRRPEAEREDEARRSEVDAKAEEFFPGLKDDLRQQRLNSIFNYTQMLKQRALGRCRR